MRYALYGAAAVAAVLWGIGFVDQLESWDSALKYAALSALMVLVARI